MCVYTCVCICVWYPCGVHNGMGRQAAIYNQYDVLVMHVQQDGSSYTHHKVSSTPNIAHQKHLAYDVLVVGVFKPFPCVEIVQRALHQYMTLVCVEIHVYIHYCVSVYSHCVYLHVSDTQHTQEWYIPGVCYVHAAEMRHDRHVQRLELQHVVQQSNHLWWEWDGSS